MFCLRDSRVYEILIFPMELFSVWVCVKLHLTVCFFWSVQDSEDEEGYYELKKRPPTDEGYAESQC